MQIKTITETHGKYEVNEYEIEITQDMRDRALAFATKIKIDDNQFSRFIPNNIQERTEENIIKILKYEIQRTYVGKLGELAFLALLHEKNISYDATDMFKIYEGQQNTDAFDFITSNKKYIDIKTGFRQNHKLLLVNRNQFENLPKDYYVGVKLNANDIPGDDKLIYWDSVQTARIKGYAEKTYLDNTEYKYFGEGDAKYLPYNNLMGIDKLLSLFKTTY